MGISFCRVLVFLGTLGVLEKLGFLGVLETLGVLEKLEFLGLLKTLGVLENLAFLLSLQAPRGVALPLRQPFL